MKINSFFKKLFICLTVLLIFPAMLINIISNYSVLKNSENEINNNNIGKLKLTENALEQLEDSVAKDAMKLSVDNRINELSNFHDKFNLRDGNNIVMALHILDTLSELVKINNKYESIYLYIEDFDYTFTSNYDLIKKNSLKDTEWMKYYNDYKSKKIPLTMIKTRPINNYEENRLNNYVISYIYPLTHYTTNLNGMLIINIKEDAINNIINGNNLSKEGYIFIANSNGNIITHPNANLLNKDMSESNYIKKIINSKSLQGFFTETIDGNKSIVSYYKSNFNNWIFISVFPLVNLTKKVNTIRLTTTYITLVIMIIGIFMSFIISKKMSSPLEKLIHDIKTTKGIDIIGNEDEFSVLHKAFNNIIKKDKMIFDILQRNKAEIKYNYLKNLLNGNISSEIDKNIVGENFIYNFYICAVISIDKFTEFNKIYCEEQDYIKNLICQVSCDIIGENFPCESVNLNKREIAIIVNTNNNDDIQLKLQQNFIKIKEELAKVLENSITVGIGTCYGEIIEINYSYFEAQTALKQKLKLGNNNIILWNKNFTNFNYYYPFKVEEHLLNYLHSQSKECIESTLDELIDDLIHKCNLSSENIVQIFTQLVGNTVIKYLLEQHLNIYSIFGAKFNIYYELSTKETIYEIKYWLLQIYFQIIDYYIKTKCSNKKSLDKIIEYINKNYKRDIGINDISDAVGLSYSHVRKIFKDEVGENIIDYINNIRITEAKEMLIKTDLSIKNIAINLGYNNDQSFTRFFKKYEGITPGEYRNKRISSNFIEEI